MFKLMDKNIIKFYTEKVCLISGHMIYYLNTVYLREVLDASTVTTGPP